MSGEHTWYVTFRRPTRMSRNSRTFRTETEAKQFARDQLAAGCDVSAGTINPHFPKRTIGPLQLQDWLSNEADVR